MTGNHESLLRVRNLTKTFPGCLAVDDVDFDLRRGEVHVLFGENGAGKTTLVNVVSGVYTADKGDIYISGEKVSLKNAHHAQSLGISAVHQGFSLIPELSIVANLFLGLELGKNHLLDKRKMAERAAIFMKSLGLTFEVDLNENVAYLTLAERQIVEIAKAFMKDARIMILDEPTSALSETEKQGLFKIIAKLKEEGKGIIYISHVMEEITGIADRVTILRDGKNVDLLEHREDITEANLIKSIVGERSKHIYPELGTKTTDKILEVKNLSTKTGLKNITFDLRAGEILGIGGLPGSGKSNVGRALFGLDKITEGEIVMFGEKLSKHLTPHDSLKRGLIYSPAEKLEGLALCRDIKENQSLPVLLEKFVVRGFIQKAKEVEAVREQIEELGIKPADMTREVQYLSGGNQQKVIIARGFLKEASIFIFDEVTRGVDVGSKIGFFALINKLARKGAAIIYISSEIPELLHLCHSVMVMYEFSIFKQEGYKELTSEKLANYLFALEGEN